MPLLLLVGGASALIAGGGTYIALDGTKKLITVGLIGLAGYYIITKKK